jgi:hypothetical protein
VEEKLPEFKPLLIAEHCKMLTTSVQITTTTEIKFLPILTIFAAILFIDIKQLVSTKSAFFK